MKRAFLYIDILGFESLARTNEPKVEKIFKILDELQSHKHKHFFDLQTIVFSDTILIFNSSDTKEDQVHIYVTYLIEYAQELFYSLARINVYFRGVLTFGDFHFKNLKNIQSYYGTALIDAYSQEKDLEGFGLFVDKNITNEIIVFDKISYSDKYDYILLCQYINNLYSRTKGKLPVDIELLTETDEFYRIDEDLRFFREIEYLMKNHPSDKVKAKYQKVYELYKSKLPLFFEKFEEEGFLPFLICDEYFGNYNPFELVSEQELNQ